jgi:hypothetical protein
MTESPDPLEVNDSDDKKKLEENSFFKLNIFIFLFNNFFYVI